MRRILYRRKWAGMTLIEMMVVIAMIAIIAALLVPGIARARDRGKKTLCLNNLHQISVGAMQMFQELGEALPERDPRGNYGQAAEQILPYVRNMKELFSCPSMVLPDPVPSYMDIDFPNFSGVYTHYEFNQMLCRHGSSTEFRTQAMIADYSEAAYAYDIFYNDESQRAHSGGVNIAFLDGHAEWMTDAQMGPVYPASPTSYSFFRRGLRFVEMGL